MTETVTQIADLRRHVATWRHAGEAVALVPTMGALHDGHMALVAEAQRRATRVVVSIFVNPLQFGPAEDFDRYPRPLERDRALLEAAGVDALFLPSVAEMYTPGFSMRIEPGPIGEVLDGAARPGHFAGVATVVAKLLGAATPDLALFGEKDWQQLTVLRKLVRELNLPVAIQGVPTVRDSDGLARSSRNVYLSPEERLQAVALPQALQAATAALEAGAALGPVEAAAEAALLAAGFASVDYVTARDAETLEPWHDRSRPGRLLAAAHLGRTRLIDNLPLSPAVHQSI